MSRYIDIETIKPRQYENSEVELGVLAYDYDEVNAMPSIDIAFCKECRWGKPYSDKQLECDALGLGGLKFPDDFCSYGEREDE